MKFEFIGTPDGPREITFHGIVFEKGLVVNVSEKKSFTIPKTGKPSVKVRVVDKLKGNKCFRLVKEKAEPKAEPKAEQEPEKEFEPFSEDD